MKKLRIGVIEIQGRHPARTAWAKLMRLNLAAIMPQVIAVWCEEAGHEVFLNYYSGHESLFDPLPDDLDVVFMSSFTGSAQVAYALSNRFRSKGAITALGGPHARSFPEDSKKYFDYVFGLTDQTTLNDVLQGMAQHRPKGVYVSAANQPRHLPGIRQRWKFIEPMLRHSPWFKMVTMTGSFGCPYTCNFCIDSTIKYQMLDMQEIQEDLRFLAQQPKPPKIVWYDPNFGVRFNEFLGAMEEAVPSGSLKFIMESTLSLLKERNVKRLKKNGCQGILPGIESWFDLSNKTRTRKIGVEKVREVSEQINMILSHVPYLQGNFILGLDNDEGPEPFELTKEYLDLAPGTFPGFNMLVAYGVNTVLNQEYYQQNRLLPLPFHFLTNSTTNVLPQHYGIVELYERWIDLREYAFSFRRIYNRMKATSEWTPKMMHAVRSLSTDGRGTTRRIQEVHRHLIEDKPFRDFYERETNILPPFFVDRIKKDLGPLWDWLPEGALHYDMETAFNSPQP